MFGMRLLYDRGRFVDKYGTEKNGRVSGVYGWKFPDGKWYVGCSSNIRSRCFTYVTKDKWKSKKGYIGFQGWDTMQMYILEECMIDLLLIKEAKWSAKLDSVDNGYNDLEGGLPCQLAKVGRVTKDYPELSERCKRVSDGMKEYWKKRKLGVLYAPPEQKIETGSDEWIRRWKEGMERASKNKS